MLSDFLCTTQVFIGSLALSPEFRSLFALHTLCHCTHPQFDITWTTVTYCYEKWTLTDIHTHTLHPGVYHLIIRFEVLYVYGAHDQTLWGEQIVPPFCWGPLMKPFQGSCFDNHWPM